MTWLSVSWPQRLLLAGVTTTVLACATRTAPVALTGGATRSVLLWTAFALNASLLLVLGPIAVETTRRWFQQSTTGRPRRERHAVRRRALLLGMTAYVGHQTLVVLLDPRFSLERLTGRRRVFGPVVTVSDRLELAWAFTALAAAYILLAWFLWRSTRVPDVPLGDVSVPRSTAILESPAPLVVAAPRAPALEALPRDPVTGRVIRQFDV